MNGTKYQQCSHFQDFLTNRSKCLSESVQTRSSWEKSFCLWADQNNSIVEWASEEVTIPYVWRVDNKRHKYYVDFWAKYKNADREKQMLYEVKPFAEMFPPKIPKRKTKSYRDRVLNYLKNMDKWKQTMKFCALQRDKGIDIEFAVITETKNKIFDPKSDNVRIFPEEELKKIVS